MLNNRILMGLFLILISVVAHSQPAGLLWKVEGKDIHTSYVFGTIHVICEDQFKFSESLKGAMKASKSLVMELDMDDPTLMAAMQKRLLNPGMANISNQFTLEEKEKVDAYLKKHYGAGLDRFGIFKPFAILSMMYMKALDCESPVSLEQKLTAMAALEGKEVLGLESVQQQMALFDSIPLSEQIDWLVNYSEDGKMKKEMAELISLYLAGDLEVLFEKVSESPEYEAYLDALLFDRNRAWIPLLQSHMAKAPTFFAVGAGHLGSENGVLALLRASGYQLTEVK